MLELADKGIKTYNYCVLYVQRAKGKIKHVKIRARKYFLKDSNWTFGDENFNVWDLKK